jgi:hypothetical protein
VCAGEVTLLAQHIDQQVSRRRFKRHGLTVDVKLQ